MPHVVAQELHSRPVADPQPGPGPPGCVADRCPICCGASSPAWFHPAKIFPLLQANPCRVFDKDAVKDSARLRKAGPSPEKASENCGSVPARALQLRGA